MYTIITPVEGYTGFGYGLHFTEGIAHTNDESIAKTLKQLGYTVEEVEGAVPSTDPTEDTDQEDPAEDEQAIRDRAKELNIGNYWNMNLDKLKAQIAQHE